jgi:ubiquinone/menaquinone biosynthesis C-methylase UbiE
MVLKQTYDQDQIHFRWESVYRSHPVLRRFNDRVMDKIVKGLNLSGDALVLDAGCGVGDHSLRLAERGYRCVGVDLSESVLTIARKQAESRGLSSRAYFACQALEELTFKDNTFDAIHCRGVLMHIPKWEAALASLCRALKPGGRIALLENNDKSLEMGLVLLVRKLQNRKSTMVKTEGGVEFWSEENGQPFVVRLADIRYLCRELGKNRVRVVKRFAHELFDVNRFPGGVLRDAFIRLDYLYFVLSLPYGPCVRNLLLAEKESAVRR